MFWRPAEPLIDSMGSSRALTVPKIVSSRVIALAQILLSICLWPQDVPRKRSNPLAFYPYHDTGMSGSSKSHLPCSALQRRIQASSWQLGWEVVRWAEKDACDTRFKNHRIRNTSELLGIPLGAIISTCIFWSVAILHNPLHYLGLLPESPYHRTWWP